MSGWKNGYPVNVKSATADIKGPLCDAYRQIENFSNRLFTLVGQCLFQFELSLNECPVFGWRATLCKA